MVGVLRLRRQQHRNPLRNEYNTGAPITDQSFGRLTRQRWGNASDIIDVVSVSQTPAAGNNFATRKVIVNDRLGNVKECFYSAAPQNRGVMLRELTGRANPDQPTTETTNRPGAPLCAGDPAQYETRWAYAASGLPSSVDLANGNTLLRTYDTANINWLARGNLLEQQRLPGPLGGDQPSVNERIVYLNGFGGGGCGCGGGGSFVTQHTDPRGGITTHSYDAQGNRTQTVHRIPGIVENWEYNTYGQVTAHIHPDNGSGFRRRDEFGYYAAGPQTGYLQSSTLDAGADGLASTTTHEYSATGHITATIDASGRRTDTARNQLDQPVRVTMPAVTTAGGEPVRYQRCFMYDAANNIVSIQESNTTTRASFIIRANPTT